MSDTEEVPYVVVIENAIDLYELLSNGRFNRTRELDRVDVEILLAIEEKHLRDLHEYCDDYCFGALILMECGKDIFYEVMDELMCELAGPVFKWIIDYDGLLTDGRNPLDTGCLNLKEAIDTIEMYYDGRYRLLYAIERYAEYASHADCLIAGDKENGRELILAALEDKVYTLEEFNPAILDDIWEEHHGA
jgi:hypothetical protein